VRPSLGNRVHVHDFQSKKYPIQASAEFLHHTGPLNLNLDFPNAAAFDEYKVLISGTGTGPAFYGVAIPLSWDSIAFDSFFGVYPVPATNMQGTLDTSGNASASLAVPAGIPLSLVGSVFYLAAIANQPGQLPEYSSVAVSLTITP